MKRSMVSPVFFAVLMLLFAGVMITGSFAQTGSPTPTGSPSGTGTPSGTPPVSPTPPAPTITVSDPVTDTLAVGSVVILNFTATGGTAPYQWDSDTLPDGLALNPSTGDIYGTPTTVGDVDVTLTVTDEAGSGTMVEKKFVLHVIAATTPTAPAVTPPAAPAAQAPTDKKYKFMIKDNQGNDVEKEVDLTWIRNTEKELDPFLSFLQGTIGYHVDREQISFKADEDDKIAQYAKSLDDLDKIRALFRAERGNSDLNVRKNAVSNLLTALNQHHSDFDPQEIALRAEKAKTELVQTQLKTAQDFLAQDDVKQALNGAGLVAPDLSP